MLSSIAHARLVCRALFGAFVFVAVYPGAASLEAQPERPFLWRIERDPPSFLFGTVHLADSRLARLPPAVTRAQDATGTTYIELDPFVDFPEPMLLLPWNQRLSDSLNRSESDRITALLRRHNPHFQFHFIDDLKPWVLEMTLLFLEEEALGPPPDEPILDLVIYERALQRGHAVGELETFAEQIGAFDAVPFALQIESLMETVAAIEDWVQDGNDPLEELILAYLSGDESALTAALFEGDDALPPEVFEALFLHRNETMARRMDRKMRDNPHNAFFFAVGVGHYVGKDSINEMLEAKGHRVTRVQSNDWPWLLDIIHDDGWRRSPWFGQYAAREGDDWLYHRRLGWFFAAEGHGGLYLHRHGQGWFWTQPDTFPALFDLTARRWLPRGG